MSGNETMALFDLPASATVVVAAPAGPVQCSECPRMLRSEKSIAAGVGPGCAAKTGRIVLASMRKAEGRKKKQRRSS